MTKATEGFVYLARHANNHVKIGCSANPEQRIASLNVGVAELTLIHKIKTNDMHRLERQLHGQFKSKRIRREWFNLSESEIATIQTITLEILPVEMNERPEGLFGPRLKELRKCAGLTQQALAEKMAMSFSAIARWESGKREPAWSNVVALASAMGVSVADFSVSPSEPSTIRGSFANHGGYVVMNEQATGVSHETTSCVAEVANKLRIAIQVSGLSLNELARQTNIDVSRLSRFMRVERDITFSAASKICLALRLTLCEEH